MKNLMKIFLVGFLQFSFLLPAHTQDPKLPIKNLEKFINSKNYVDQILPFLDSAKLDQNNDCAEMKLYNKSLYMIKVVTFDSKGVPIDGMWRHSIRIQGCGSNYIDEFKPNYVIFDESFTYAGKPHIPTLILKTYVENHHFILVRKLKDQDNEISIYKKSSTN